jgi:hypothetical protein
LQLDTDTGGETAIVAWSASGAAEGRATVTVAGDDRRPVVWELRADAVAPGLVDALVLDFSEPLLLASLTEAQFAVSSESAALGFSVDVAGDARTVRLVLDVPHALDDGALVVTAWSTAGLAVRDLAGNKLDGTFSGEASSFIGVWGVAGAGPDVLDCGVDLGRFTPDGDPGSAFEADAVRFDAAAASTPAHWWVTVTGPDGGVRWRERSEASSSDFVWSWDGRDRDGAVVDAGFYRLTVDARDGFGNRGGACSAVVQVVQHAGY